MAQKRILFVRHGETMFNALNKVQGSSDIPLNPRGVQQAYEFKLPDIDFDLACHSGLQRSKDTLKYIMDQHKLTLPMLESSQLEERRYGIFEGHSHLQIKTMYPILYEKWRKDENTDIQGAEKLQEVLDRIKIFIDDIYFSSSHNILVVTHSGLMYTLYKWLMHMSLSDVPKLKINNLDTIDLKFTIENGRMSYLISSKENEYISSVLM